MLGRVDRLLGTTVDQMVASSSPEAGQSAVPGLFLTSTDVKRLLRAPRPPRLLHRREVDIVPAAGVADEDWAPWIRLRTAFDLDSFDVAVLALSMTVELDLRYQRIFGWLQDDLTRLRPTLELVLDLLCDDQEERVRRISHLDRESNLLRHGLLRLIPDPHQNDPPRLAWYLVPGEGLLSFLLGRATLGDRLGRVARRTEPTLDVSDVPVSADIHRGIERVIETSRDQDAVVRLHLNGPAGSGQREVAETMASALGRALLTIDLGLFAQDLDVARADLELAIRYATLHDCVVWIDGGDRLAAEIQTSMERLVRSQLAEFPGIAVTGASLVEARTSLSDHTRDAHLTFRIDLAPLDPDTRETVWRTALENAGIAFTVDDIVALANRYRLLPEQIAASVHAARGIAALHGSPAVTPSELSSAARAQSFGYMHSSAQVRVPAHGWDDIVLPRDQKDQLREICDHAEYRHVVHREWAREHRTATPTGLNALFSGPSGTGKTLAAEIIAGELGMHLATVEIAQVVSKYIGETEKNLDHIFDSAGQSDVVLFFDEADAIFGKRSAVREAHDRYANLEVGYLLQKIENHEGIVLLCTNLRSNMDDAFARRLHHVVEFPFPDAPLRLQIWRRHLHDRIPRSNDLDLDLLARQFDIAGGSIRSIVVNACVFAAAAHQSISMRHLVLATRRELQKMGRVCDEQTFGETIWWLEVPEDVEELT